MELYVIRHAEAIELGERGITNDEERPLTELGQGQAEALARAAKRGIVFDKLLTSPLVRAKQTAEIMLRVWERPELTLELCDALAPGVKLRKLSKSLAKLDGEKLGIVGHMPQLGEFIAWLLGDKRSQIDLAKAGVAHLVCGDGPFKGLASVRWIVTPEWY